jgi:hypothetical protein
MCVAGLLLTAAAAPGSSVGDTYQQVIAENGNPRSQVAAAGVRILNYPDATIKIKDNLVISIKAAGAQQQPVPQSPAAAAPLSPEAQVAALKKQQDDAEARVRSLVNQPVSPVERTPEMPVTIFGPPWFHTGATTPDFNDVDIRKTRETPYDPYEYVSTELNPGLAWVGRELEFNPMTKFFYTDRSVPKKKLTEEEMPEINGLYRIIGRCEQQLGQLQALAR